MNTGNCTNCGLPSATEYCALCEPLRERLETLRAAQAQRRRDVRSGKGILKRPPKPRPGAWFMQQSRKHGPAVLAKRLAEEQQTTAALTLSGQDAALPVGDR